MEDRVTALEHRIADLEHRIHVLEHPMRPKRELDGAMAELRALHAAGAPLPPTSPLWRDGGPPRGDFETARHRSEWPDPPAVQSVPDLKQMHAAVAARESDPTYVASATMPGVEVVITYVNGQLARAVLRGDGVEGDDVTDNVRAVPSVPLKLRPAGSITESRVTKLTRQALGPATLSPVPPFPPELHIRVTFAIRTLDLVALDRRRVDAGEPPYVEPRAATFGSLRRLDPRITATRRLKAFAIGCDAPPPGIDSEWQLLGALKSWGFSVLPVTWRCKGLQEVLDFVAALQQIAPTFEYPLEGGSLVVNRLAFGSEPEDPPRAVKLVFPAPGRSALVKKTYHAVGRGGCLLPVALLEKDPATNLPVPERAPVPPRDGADGLRLAPGTKVKVRPGSVAPVVAVDGPGEAAPHPRQCPACGTALHAASDEPFRVCVNSDCVGRARGRLLHVAGPRGLGLESLDVKLVDRLIGEHGLREGIELFELDPAKVEALSPGSGERFAAEMRAARRMPLWRLLYLVAIPHVSEHAARVIAHHVVDLDRLERLSPREALEVPNLPAESAIGLSRWLESDGPRTFTRVRAIGLELVDAKEAFCAPFLGQNVVLAGKLARGAAHAGDEIERRGGLLHANVGRLTDLLVHGEGGEREFDTAAMYRVPVVDERAFEHLLARSRGR